LWDWEGEEEKERRGERSRSNFDLIGDSELIINFRWGGAGTVVRLDCICIRDKPITSQ
jgi:hypothetical protein